MHISFPFLFKPESNRFKNTIHIPFRQWLVVGLLSFLSLAVSGQSSPGSIFLDTVPTLISSQFSFTEGPAVDRQGNVFFTDQPNNKIWKYSIDGKLSVFLDNAGRSNGMYFDRAGNLITCADEKNELWSIDPKGKITVLLKDFKGHRFNGPNDVWLDSKDGAWFTDPYYQRNYWQRKAPDSGIGGQKLYYLAKGKTEAVVVDDKFKQPNGIIGTPDGKYLFVSDIGAGIIYKYRINSKGDLSDRQVFVKDVADGLTLDSKGNLYLAGKGVTVYDSTGNKIGHIDIPAGWTANVCFGGAKRDLLFITASQSAFLLRMNVKGGN